MAARLVDADALEQIITEKFKEHYGNTAYQFIRDFFTFVIRQIRKAPTIEAEPVKWLPASEPPDHYRDEYGELIPLLVCEDGTDYPYRAFYDGRKWGDGYVVVQVKWWMPLPQPPKDGGADHEGE